MNSKAAIIPWLSSYGADIDKLALIYRLKVKDRKNWGDKSTWGFEGDTAYTDCCGFEGDKTFAANTESVILFFPIPVLNKKERTHHETAHSIGTSSCYSLSSIRRKRPGYAQTCLKTAYSLSPFKIERNTEAYRYNDRNIHCDLRVSQLGDTEVIF